MSGPRPNCGRRRQLGWTGCRLSRVHSPTRSHARPIRRISGEHVALFDSADRESQTIVVHPHTVIEALEGDAHLERVRWRDTQSGLVETNDVQHVFVMMGAVPNTRWVAGSPCARWTRIYQDRARSFARRSGRSPLLRIC